MPKDFDINNFYKTTDTDMIPVGTAVPEGFYTCLSCGNCVPILEDGNKLPKCKCNSSTYWMKI